MTLSVRVACFCVPLSEEMERFVAAGPASTSSTPFALDHLRQGRPQGVHVHVLEGQFGGSRVSRSGIMGNRRTKLWPHHGAEGSGRADGDVGAGYTPPQDSHNIPTNLQHHRAPQYLSCVF